MKNIFLYLSVGIALVVVVVVAVLSWNDHKRMENSVDETEICQLIVGENIQEDIFFPQSISGTAKKYYKKLRVMNDDSQESIDISRQLDGENPDLRCILQYLYDNGTDYFVCRKNDFFEVGCNWFSSDIICETEEYSLVHILRDEYVVIEYASVSGSQAMIYTIMNDRGDLVIVDGGYDVDANYLKQVISTYHNCVNAWILTHPHPDHISAFNEIYQDLDIKIAQIYAIDIDSDYYHKAAQEWDQISVFDKFCELTKDADNLNYLCEGDCIDLIGMKMEVLHAYDDAQMDDAFDPCNDGGLIFKLTGKNQSMLFLSDVGISQDAYMKESYGDRLCADYVQMGHHGNGGMSEELYGLVAPRVAFFDAPEWLMVDETRNAPAKKRYMESIGAEVFDYTTAPNRIVIK